MGGGTAGVAAAVASARNGVDTLLVERYGFLGGTMTAGLVNPFMTYYAGGKQIIHGVFQEMLDRLESLDGYDRETRAFDVEAMKLTCDQMVKEASVKVLLHTCVIDALMEEKDVRGLEIYNKSGRQVVLAKAFVDATGDGDVAVMAGAIYEKGRSGDGLAQPMTLNFRMGGVDIDSMPSREEMNRLFREAKLKGEVTVPREDLLWFFTTRRGEIHFNTTRIVEVDGINAEDLTYAEFEGRRQMVELEGFLKKKVPGFEEAYLLMSGIQVGVRETRRIMGEYMMTGRDIVEAGKFKDSIAKGSYPIDIHNPKGEGTVIKAPPPREFYEIPYRCLIPRKVENLLVAGRCISTTHEAQAAVRVIPIVVAIGQAAGTAAAMSVKYGVCPRTLDVHMLRETLRKQGANLD